MFISETLFLLFIFFKQFYIFPSGSLQPADFFLVLAFLIFVIIKLKNKSNSIYKLDKFILIFIFFVYLINLVYYFFYCDKSFLVSIFYYTYIAIFIILFRELIRSTRFLIKLCSVFKGNIVVQFAIFFLNKIMGSSSPRYMGTFNDPNQLGFFIFISIMILILLYAFLYNRFPIVIFIIALFLILQTGSTGMLIGIIIFVILYFFIRCRNFKLKRCIKKKNLLNLISIILVIFLLLLNYKEVISDYITELTILDRLEEKVSNINNDNTQISLVEERGYDKIIIYPEKIFLGAGEGGFERFNKTFHQLEIHASFPAILFYYGIFPTCLVLIWIFKNIRYVPNYLWPVYIALLFESCTLANQRQPFFWMIFILGSLWITNEAKTN